MSRTTTPASQRESAQAAVRHLNNVTPAQVQAMQEAGPDTMRALWTAVTRATMRDHDDVREHAVLLVAAIYAGTAGEGIARTEHAARRARRYAVTHVRQAAALRAETAVGVEAGDFDYLHDDMSRTAVSHWGTHPADTVARTTVADVVDTAAAMVPALAPVVTAWRGHGPECQHCTADRERGRKVAPSGILAHVAGVTDASGDPAYDRLTRQARTAVKAASARREDVLCSMDGAPLAGMVHKPAGTPHRTPVTTAHPAGYADVAVRRELDALGYPAALGYGPTAVVVGVTRRAMTPREVDAAQVCTCPADALHDDCPTHGYAVRAAHPLADPDAAGQTRTRDTRRDGGAGPRPRPRKGARGGQTGPTVPVRLAR